MANETLGAVAEKSEKNLLTLLDKLNIDTRSLKDLFPIIKIFRTNTKIFTGLPREKITILREMAEAKDPNENLRSGFTIIDGIKYCSFSMDGKQLKLVPRNFLAFVSFTPNSGNIKEIEIKTSLGTDRVKKEIRGEIPSNWEFNPQPR
jgi:hypothetical protein